MRFASKFPCGRMDHPLEDGESLDDWQFGLTGDRRS